MAIKLSFINLMPPKDGFVKLSSVVVINLIKNIKKKLNLG